MRIVHITAGAGGRICGSCLHDNALVRALRQRGRDAILLPAYVPTTTDEENVAERRVVMGGVNIWLQEFVPFFRHTPWFLDRLLDGRRLLTWLAGQTAQTKPEDLGTITVSALEGEGGHQRKEVEKLARLLRDELEPDVVHLSNILLLGLARPIRAATGAAIVSSLSGEDIFIGQLPPAHRDRVLRLLRERSADVDRFVALNRAFADQMAPVLGVAAESIAVVPHGVDSSGFPATPPDLLARRRGQDGRLRIGSLARACPEKGLDVLIRAVATLAATHDVTLVAAGAEIEAERPYLDRCKQLAAELGLADRFEWRGQVDRAGKLALLAEVRRLTAALDGVRREERARCIAWLRAHDATTTAREAAVELQQCAWGVELLTEPVEADDATAKESAFVLTIDGKPVTMTVGEVTRTTEGRREVFWSTRVATKAAGLRTYDHHHSGNSRMEAVGWTLQVLAGEGIEPTAMAWTATGSAT